MRDFRLIQIQTTSVCNGRCIVCPYKDSWFIKNPGKMSEQLFDRILRDIKREDPNFDGLICPYLMNEPFADSNILNRIRKIYKMFPNATVEVSTNCELLDKEKATELVNILKDKRCKIVISHHGINKKTFEQTMGINYEKALTNAINLISISNGRIPIAIQDMATSIDNQYRLIQPRRIERYWKDLFDDAELAWNNVWLSTMKFHNRAGNVIVDGWEYNKKVREIDENNPFDCYRANGECLHILYDGDVALCCMDYHKEVIYGNLKDQTISEVFESKAYKNIYNQVHGNIKSPDDFICKRCQSPGG